MNQGLVKGAILCFKNLYFYFRHGESTSTASQLTSPASQKSKNLNKVPLLLQDLDVSSCDMINFESCPKPSPWAFQSCSTQPDDNLENSRILVCTLNIFFQKLVVGCCRDIVQFLHYKTRLGNLRTIYRLYCIFGINRKMCLRVFQKF